MKALTETIVLEAPGQDVFDYLADVRNLPGWATEFARELKVVDGGTKVVNGRSELFFRIQADRSTGVIDMLAGPSEDELARFPTRVVELPGNSSLFTFTMVQGPGMSDALFAEQHASLVRELENVAARFSSR